MEGAEMEGEEEVPVTPVTIEAPDGSRHGMDVELEGLGSTAELRQGMLQGYNDLLGLHLPPHALRVHARLRSGTSVLLTDETPLSATILDAVSFYVWAVLEPAEKRALSDRPARGGGGGGRGRGATVHHFASTTVWPPPKEPIVGAETPSVSELKGMLGVGRGGGRSRHR